MRYRNEPIDKRSAQRVGNSGTRLRGGPDEKSNETDSRV